MINFEQRLDISLKTRALWYKSNPYGWQIHVIYCEKEELNEKERYYIQKATEKGYELYNITSGGQDEGKEDINERKASKGYRDGLNQGRINAIKEIKEFFDNYCDFVSKSNPECFKKDGSLKEIYTRKFNELKELLYGEMDNTKEKQSN